jgi:hypothetical protein
LLHPPQCELSDETSTHALPHCIVPDAHPHVPAEHAKPSAVSQATPHAPQLFGSLWSGMQLPLQYAWPVGHVHAPPAQVAPAPHAAAQEPQFASSRLVSTHAPWQFDSWPPASLDPH